MHRLTHIATQTSLVMQIANRTHSLSSLREPPEPPRFQAVQGQRRAAASPRQRSFSASCPSLINVEHKNARRIPDRRPGQTDWMYIDSPVKDHDVDPVAAVNHVLSPKRASPKDALCPQKVSHPKYGAAYRNHIAYQLYRMAGASVKAAFEAAAIQVPPPPEKLESPGPKVQPDPRAAELKDKMDTALHYYRKSGMWADDIAELLGYENDREFLKALNHKTTNEAAPRTSCANDVFRAMDEDPETSQRLDEYLERRSSETQKLLK